MYNGIGLSTPRGSGTSGYIQKNLAHVNSNWKQQLKSRDQFLRELKEMKNNVQPTTKKANEDILKHQQQREIYLHLAQMREQLEDKGIEEEEIEQRLSVAEKLLWEKYEKGEFNATSVKDTHQQAAAKQKEEERLRQAFKIEGQYKSGNAFDFDEQEKKRLQKQLEKEQKEGERFEKLKQDKIEKKVKEMQLIQQQKKLEKQKLKELEQPQNQNQNEKKDQKSDKQDKDKNDKEKDKKEKKQKKENKRSRSRSESKEQKKNKDKKKQK